MMKILTCRINLLIRTPMLWVCLISSVLPLAETFGAEPVKIGVLAFRPKPQTLAQWQPLVSVLKQAMPERDFEIEVLTFPELDMAVASRQLDFVLTNPGHYVLLARRSGLSAPLATLAVNDNGRPNTAFGGVIFSRAQQADINTLGDIDGKTIAVTSTDSLGGYQMQAYELQQAGVRLPQDAKLVITGMPHDNVVEAVLTGRADVGFVRTGVLESMARESKLDITQLKVLNSQNLPGFPALVSTQLYPEWPIASLPHIDDGLAKHVAAILFLLDENTAVTRAMDIYGFSVPADYTPVADLLKELRLPPFDSGPQFTLQDVLLRYRLQVASASIASGFILLLVFRLLLTKRKLEAAHQALLSKKQQLQEAERKHSDILESVNSYIYLKDTEGRYLFANRPVRELFGMSMDEIVGQGDEKFFDAETTEKLRTNDRQVLENRETLNIEETNLNLKDGQISTYLTVKLPLCNETGEVYALCGISTDITERKQAEDRLRKSEESLKESQIIAGLGSYVLDIPSNRWESSDVLDKLFGIDPMYERTVEGWAALIHPYDRAMMEDFFKNEVLGHGNIFDKEYRIVRAENQAERWVHGLGKLEFDAQGQPVKMHGTIQDITERKRVEEKLQLAARVFTHAREGIMITTADGTIVDVNDTFSAITGYAREEVLGRNPRLFSSGLQSREFYTALWDDLIENGYWYGEIWNRRKNGEVYALMLTISAVCDAHNNTQHYVALFSDITSLKEHEKQLEHIAHYDALTNLPNRVLLADRLRQAMSQAQRRNQRLAVVFLDLDGFKAINDNHGHEAGDQLLMIIAIRMKQALREGDTLARLGGDEFVAVMLDLADTEASIPMLTRLLNAAAQPLHIGGLSLQVSASLGITFYPQQEDVDADQLLRQADQAMYQAKLAGKNRYHVFDAEQDRSVRGYHESIEHIRNALAEREFVLYYQPKVNMRTGKVIGAEALIRWQHPEKGLLPPNLFLPVIENHPLSIQLGEWVIEAALAQLELWHSAGLDIPVSVNINALQLQQPNFIEHLSNLLLSHPTIKPGNLEMEVLETSALEDLVHVSQVIAASRKLGVNFALDDFGTGYSSMTYLKRLPVTQLKIDQSFVRDMLDDPDDLAIVQGILGLANAFYREVIAEGVETIAHGTVLLQLGCELGQGYGIARPMPAHEFPGWFSAWQPDPKWANLPIADHGSLSILHAAVELRAWFAAIESYLKSERNDSPPLDPMQCRFGIWLNTVGLEGHIGQQAFTTIKPLHRQIHACAAELCELKINGQSPEALAMLAELYQQRDTLLKQLEILTLEKR
ncbi:EAL domain-containing protein [Candidatus Methylobacter oryzae]|uniref:EAL domain-containing protein n=2 Tax=Candidatus Methylobacter oryzae TaxID=2497749 RepID=A0ABY3CB33_9GAMM|nr:EAL domain-containing protein [Candidatus Methylobacter oryzae]